MASSYLIKAERLKRQGKLKEAIALLREAINLNPNFFWYYHKLGEAMAKLGNWDEAINAYLKAIELNSNSALSHRNLGEVFEKKGNSNEALDAYQRALNLNPDCENFSNSFGKALLGQNKFSEAISFYQKAIEMHPNRCEYYFNLGFAFTEEGNKEEAIALYQKAIKIAPDAISKSRQQLEEILNLGKGDGEIETIHPRKELREYQKIVTSQFGEDGIIEEIFKRLNIDKGWCVEFGAADGKRLSNTWHLWHNCGWNAVLIEGDSNNYQQLLLAIQSFSNVKPLQSFVAFEGEQTLDKILQKTDIPQDFELLSIDIDGDDYYVWKSIEYFRPKVVIIEHNPTFPPHIEFVDAPRKAGKAGFGSSAKSLAKLGSEKGYELVACTVSNCLFVEGSLLGKLNIKVEPITQTFPQDEIRYVVFSYKGQPFLIPGKVAYGSFKNLAAISNQLRPIEPIPANSRQVAIAPSNVFQTLQEERKSMEKYLAESGLLEKYQEWLQQNK